MRYKKYYHTHDLGSEGVCTLAMKAKKSSNLYISPGLIVLKNTNCQEKLQYYIVWDYKIFTQEKAFLLRLIFKMSHFP